MRSRPLHNPLLHDVAYLSVSMDSDTIQSKMHTEHFKQESILTPREQELYCTRQTFKPRWTPSIRTPTCVLQHPTLWEQTPLRVYILQNALRIPLV